MLRQLRHRLSLFLGIKTVLFLILVWYGPVTVYKVLQHIIRRYLRNKQNNGLPYDRLPPNSLPIGSIIMFHGSSDIPHGWIICNGQNGTPNMVNRFVAATELATESGITEDKKLQLTLTDGGAHSHSIAGSHKTVLTDVSASGKKYDSVTTAITINDETVDHNGLPHGFHTHDVQTVTELKPDMVKMLFIMRVSEY